MDSTDRIGTPDVVSTLPADRRAVAAARRVSRATRRRVLERDGYRCLACGATEDLTMDHIHPVVRGGRGKQRNLQTLCRACNVAKGVRGTNYRPGHTNYRPAREREILGTLLGVSNANAATGSEA